jgi:hypothetical protein
MKLAAERRREVVSAGSQAHDFSVSRRASGLARTFRPSIAGFRRLLWLCPIDEKCCVVR